MPQDLVSEALVCALGLSLVHSQTNAFLFLKAQV